MQCTSKFSRGRLILLWPANVMIYGTCGLPELLIKEQHGNQSLIRATVKGQKTVIKRLSYSDRKPIRLCAWYRKLSALCEKLLTFYPCPAYLAVRGFRAPVCDKTDLALIYWSLMLLCCLLLNLHGVRMKPVDTQRITIAVLQLHQDLKETCYAVNLP